MLFGRYWVGLVLRCAVGAWLTLASMLPAFATPIGTVTLLDGKALLTRGINRFELQEGARLEKGDILEVGNSSFAQVEFGAGPVIAAGPQARMLILSVSGGVKLFLLQGQLKTMVREKTPFRLVTQPVSVSVTDATAVLQSNAAGVALFMERGNATVEERVRNKASGKPLVVKSGEFYSREADKKSEVTPRPPAVFVAGLPRPFIDNLPLRLEKFKGREVNLKKTESFTYADVEAWLKSIPPVREVLVSRWQAKAREPAFRKALIANLSGHPEWDRILFPEKYQEAAKTKQAATPKR